MSLLHMADPMAWPCDCLRSLAAVMPVHMQSCPPKCAVQLSVVTTKQVGRPDTPDGNTRGPLKSVRLTERGSDPLQTDDEPADGVLR